MDPQHVNSFDINGIAGLISLWLSDPGRSVSRGGKDHAGGRRVLNPDSSFHNRNFPLKRGLTPAERFAKLRLTVNQARGVSEMHFEIYTPYASRARVLGNDAVGAGAL
jgi:hypothetical protein